MVKNLFLIVTLFYISAIPSLGQNVCGIDYFLKKQFEINPKAKVAHAKWLETRKEREISLPKSEQSGVKIIPVVFHVIHQYGSENISKSTIDETLAIMNADYRKQNEYIGDISPSFSGIAADCEIEFRLATIDPNGNCTQGITRHYSALTENANDNVKSIVGWPNTKYLNVWVVKSINESSSSSGGVTLGYAYYPDVMQWGADIDGIVVRADALGANSARNGRTLTHEAGHYLDLPHTFEGENCFDSGDGINDTPQEAGIPYFDCELNYTPCSNAGKANIENFMSYASCQKMFTNGQKNRINSTLVNDRYILVSTSNLAATGTQNAGMTTNCTPIADFLSNNQLLCQGESVSFSDFSYNGTPNSWNWVFDGGTPGSSSDPSPTITYNQPGSYTVKLTVSNSNGQSTSTKTQYINIEPNTAVNNTGPFLEGFENSPLANGLWSIENPNNNTTWSEISTTAASGNKCIKLNNSINTTSGQVDALISNSYNFSSLNNIEFHFKVAYRQKTSSSSDLLKVYFSTDCGKTWVLRYSRQGATMTDVAPATPPFTPSPSQWREETVSLPTSVKNSTNVRFKFEFTSGGGNNIYLDDINITGTVGIQENSQGIKDLTISPNPAKENSEIRFFSQITGDINFAIRDLSGREIFSQKIQVQKAGFQTITLYKQQFSSGVYILSLEQESIIQNKKMIWE